ncbi:MAG TPA: ADP-forming succinate--CoA ligase subunit beta [Gammaproteobacteria bacterium]|jgi:succinyl-CoA synthetase beta subunit|nr:ADP-forming succinate--CoA ligase subunit beta [Gammaproteobacteria bacterium]
MHLHEYQSKQLFAEYNIPVPAGRLLESTAATNDAADAIGGEAWVVKAQVHAGGRGKGGGVKVVQGRAALSAAVQDMLGMRLVTKQTDAGGLPVNSVLVEQTMDIEREFYLGVLVDRTSERVTLMVSKAGGMNIEEVAASDPDAIIIEHVNPAVGLQAYQCRNLAFALELAGGQVAALAKLLAGVYRLLQDCDASLVEINPLVVTTGGELVALDAKVDLDDNALFRHEQLAQLRDASQEDARENIARQHGLNYIRLHGNIACMVNGAGLAMATMDLIQLHGGTPANFLDVGGGATADRVAEAFKIILSDPRVEAILVNIFGGIVRCDLIAQGILQAIEEVSIEVPVVVRLEGTNAAAGLELIAQSGLSVETASDLTEAAEKVVAAGAA